MNAAFPIAGSPPKLPIHWSWHELPPGTAAESLARDWLCETLQLPATAVTLRRGPHGRPQLARVPGKSRMDANWSHSGGGLLLACGSGVRIGVDLEHLRPRPRALELARRYFTAAESDWLAAHDADARMPAFIRLWCAKEALLKAHGRGLAFGLHRLQFADRDGALALVDCDPALGAPGDWQLHEWSPRPGFHAALAWQAL